MSERSIEQFEKIDPERITGYLLDIFSSDIRWGQSSIKIDDMQFGVFRILPASTKPVIAKKDDGKDTTIKNGDIYFRYGGRTQKIQSAELENIINYRIEQNNNSWLDLMEKIGKAGPQNAAILDTERALIEKGNSQVLVLDEGLARKLKFVKEGEFVEKKGAITLKLIGDVLPIDKVEVVTRIKEDLIKRYPLSAADLATEIKKQLPRLSINKVWTCIKDNKLKNNADYSAYNFRNKNKLDHYNKTGQVVKGTPSIYNQAAVNFIFNALK